MEDIIRELQDLRYLNWSKTRKSSGIAGSFLKSYEESGEKKIYYKLSDFDSVRGIVGHECVNEIIVQRLLNMLEIEHVDYTLIHAVISIDGQDYETYLCRSEDFKKSGESKISLEDYYAMERKGNESSLDFCINKGWENYAYDMLLIDYLVLNRDRHGANIEVLRNPKDRTDRIAPLFDHGLSLVCRCHTKKELSEFDVMEDKKVQSFIGTDSSAYNLKLIPMKILKKYPSISRTELNSIFEGLEDIIGKDYIRVIKKMIWERWCYLDSIRNS